MAVVFKKTEMLTDTPLHYCPGCTHGIAHRLVAEAIEELGLKGRVVGIAPVGCAVFAYKYFNCDMQEAAHGRAPAVATGIKLTITVIFINNAIYGMTGGQMAPTTLLGQKATTCPAGRDAKVNGNPIRMSEMLATLDGPSYIARCSLADVPNIKKAKKAILQAFKNQMEGKGFSFVELLSTCPTNWHMSPVKALDFVKNEMTAQYPLGVFKEVE